jgi:hypothetical protein
LKLDDPFVRKAVSGTHQSLNIIPPENDTPTVLFLLKYNRKTDAANLKKLQLTKDDTNQYLASAFTLEKMEIVKRLMADIFVSGKRINDNQARDLAFLSDQFALNPESDMLT